jgi:hypothetical protein
LRIVDQFGCDRIAAFQHCAQRRELRRAIADDVDAHENVFFLKPGRSDHNAAATLDISLKSEFFVKTTQMNGLPIDV